MAKVVKSLLVNGVCLAISLPISFAIGQSVRSGSQPSKAASQPETPAPKLTPEQERGLRLLNAAIGESGGLQPNMHAFVLWRASYAYTKLDPKHAEKLSRDAFMATLTIEDPPVNDRCGAPGSAGDIKSWIQMRVLYDMVHRDQLKEVEQLLPQATSTVRNATTVELVRYYESKKDLQHAETSLSTLADSDRYPFGVAADLFTAFGPESSADRINIFNQALNNFESQAAAKTAAGGDDIGTFIEHTWKDVPPGLALEAIQKVLDATKDNNDSQSNYSISSAKESVVLNSTYALRLFQLLPILQELDDAEAEALLRDQTQVAEQLKAYPGGTQSLQSQNTRLSYGVGGGGVGNMAADQQMRAQMQNRVEDVLSKADADPAGALATALTLPVHGMPVYGMFEPSSPRTDALLGIAEKAAAKKPSVSKSALDEFSTIQDQLTPQEMTGIDKLPELYLNIGDVDGAKKAVDILVKAAGKLYEHDTDTDDPNTAFKGSWPSTDLWGKAIRATTKISPELPEGIIAGLKDAEIAVFEKVTFATALVGGAKIVAPDFVANCRKHGASFHSSSWRR